MKNVLSLLLLAGLWNSGVVASAESLAPQSFVQIQNAQLCEFWSYITTDRGGGYVCSIFPRQATIADGVSVQMTVQDLESRIEKLESKIKDLEAALAK